MEKKEIKLEGLAGELKTSFPVHIEMQGDDFNFSECIDMQMAGQIIAFIGEVRDKHARKYKSL